MHATPVVRQIRRAVTLVSGATAFEVTTIVTDKGDLPIPELFVARIADPANPKADTLARVATPRDFHQESDALYIKVAGDDVRVISGDPFARVANVAELSTLARDRTTAVRRGQAEYLTASLTLTFPDVVTADAAYRTLLDRLSRLVSTWRTYQDRFVTNPATDYDLPVANLTEEAARIAAFRAARTARLAAQATRSTLQTQRDACEAHSVFNRNVLDILTEDVAFLDRARLQVSLTTETGSTNVKAFVLDGSDANSYETLLSQKRAAKETYRLRVVADAAECLNLQTQLLNATAAVTSAQAQEDAALARVLEICPTFDPNSA